MTERLPFEAFLDLKNSSVERARTTDTHVARDAPGCSCSRSQTATTFTKSFCAATARRCAATAGRSTTTAVGTNAAGASPTPMAPAPTCGTFAPPSQEVRSTSSTLPSAALTSTSRRSSPTVAGGGDDERTVCGWSYSITTSSLQTGQAGPVAVVSSSGCSPVHPHTGHCIRLDPVTEHRGCPSPRQKAWCRGYTAQGTRRTSPGDSSYRAPR